MKWESSSVPNISIEDLDKESFDIFRREALRSGRMTKKDLVIGGCYVKIGKFEGSEILYQD